MNSVIEQAVDKVKTGLGRLVHREVRPVERMQVEAPKALPPSAEVPAIDVFEGKTDLLIVADLPGADTTSTSVYWDGTTLSIDARSSSADEAQGELAWSRSLVLPELAEGEKAKCSVKHGVLTIRVPKARAPSAQVIPVRAG